MDKSHGLFLIIGNVLIHWAAIVATASVVVHARVPWWRSVFGRHLFYYMLAMAIVLVLSCIRIDAGGDTWWFALLRLLTFVAVPVVMTQRLWLQIKAQRDVRANDPSPPDGRFDTPGHPEGSHTG